MSHLIVYSLFKAAYGNTKIHTKIHHVEMQYVYIKTTEGLENKNKILRKGFWLLTRFCFLK